MLLLECENPRDRELECRPRVLDQLQLCGVVEELVRVDDSTGDVRELAPLLECKRPLGREQPARSLYIFV